MLAKQDRPLFVALLAIAAAIIITWSVPSPHTKQEYGGDKCTTHECREDAATDALAFYTELLAWFTGLLAIVSMAQGYFLLRADRTAQKAIDLARSEFISTHRPKLRVRNPRIEVEPAPGEQCHPRMVISNVGDSTASSIRIHIFVYMPEIHGEGPWKWSGTFKPIAKLRAGQSEIVEQKIPFIYPETENFIPFMPGRFRVSAIVKYADESGVTRTTTIQRIMAEDRMLRPAIPPNPDLEYED